MDLRFAVVCSSNQNRSMEAHSFLKKNNLKVKSFGSGSHVKLPGTAPNKPNVYPFLTPYEHMYTDLCSKDKQLYTQNGLLYMLDRNRRIKDCPERFQDSKDRFDVIVCCEERVYDQILDDLENREPAETSMESVHVINLDVTDNHEEATMGAITISRLCTLLNNCEDIDNEIDELLQDFEVKYNKALLHTVVFY